MVTCLCLSGPAFISSKSSYLIDQQYFYKEGFLNFLVAAAVLNPSFISEVTFVCLPGAACISPLKLLICCVTQVNLWPFSLTAIFLVTS